MTADDPEFSELIAFLNKVPAIVSAKSKISCGRADDRNWWVKFTIDLEHQLAWSTVQEFGYVLNYLSLNEPLPTVFKPVSPPPYLNGGPEFLSWVIQSLDPEFEPKLAAKWLEGRLPDPIEDPTQWPINQSEI
jgi:hypothetical protein